MIPEKKETNEPSATLDFLTRGNFRTAEQEKFQKEPLISMNWEDKDQSRAN